MAGIMTLFGSFLLLTVAQAGKSLPTGFFELRQASDTAQKVTKSIAWQRTDVTGIAIRVYWSAVQPTSMTEYDWSYIDTVASLAQQYGKKFSICVIGGFNTPSWVYQNGLDGNGSTQFTISGTAVSGVMPAPWDPNFQRRWSTFLAAAGARYDALPELAYVIVTGQGWGGQATFCRSVADNTELSADGGINVWINAYEAIVGLYVRAFSQTPLIVNIGAPIYPKLLGGFRTASDACLALYGTQYGIKNNGLNPTFSTKGWQPTEIHDLSGTNPVGFQDLAASATRTDLVQSIEIGEEIGSPLFEVYPNDLKLVSDLNNL
jgi:hypothetical protein